MPRSKSPRARSAAAAETPKNVEEIAANPNKVGGRLAEISFADMLYLPILIMFPFFPVFVIGPFMPMLLAFATLKWLVVDPLKKRFAKARNAETQILASKADMNVTIIGCGFSGINMGIELKKRGIDFTILERTDGCGGTWHDNVYPGCECDIPSHLYAFSFAPKHNWKGSYAPQPEIEEYLNDVFKANALKQHVRFGTEVKTTTWDAKAKLWRIETSKGTFTSRILVSAVGALNVPVYPDVEGRDLFTGKAFHTFYYDKSVNMKGKRVAVIGSAASAVQAVPEIAQEAKEVFVFQRTPNWIFPKMDGDFSRFRRALHALFPPFQMAYRWFLYWRQELQYQIMFGKRSFMSPIARRGIRMRLLQMFGPEKGAELMPDYAPGCKRILITNKWYTALQRDNVTVVPHHLKKMTATSVVGGDGIDRPVDVVVFATGFDPTAVVQYKCFGRDGASLKDIGNDIQTFYGLSAEHFPNFFMLLGPNTGLGHNTVVWMVECQVNYIMTLLDQMVRQDIQVVEPTSAAVTRFNQHIDSMFGDMVWTSGCRSWYQTDKGRLLALWPGTTFSYWWGVYKANLNDWKTT